MTFYPCTYSCMYEPTTNKVLLLLLLVSINSICHGGGDNSAQNVFGHCVQTHKRRKLKLGGF